MAYYIDKVKVDAIPYDSSYYPFNGSVGDIVVDISGDSDIDVPFTATYELNLDPGPNVVRFKAYDPEDPDGPSTEYELTIIREPAILGDLTLDGHSLNGGATSSVKLFHRSDLDTSSMGFMSTTTTYYAEVPYHINKVDVAAMKPPNTSTKLGLPPTSAINALIWNATTSRGESTVHQLREIYGVSINGGKFATTSSTTLVVATSTVDLKRGDNQITVKAQILGNTSVDYTVNVRRKDPSNKPSELNLIEYLNKDGDRVFEPITSWDPEYDQDDGTSEYRVRVRSNVASVGIAADHEDASSTIYVDGIEIPKNARLPHPSYRQVELTGDTTTINVRVDHSDIPSGGIDIVIVRNREASLEFMDDMHPVVDTSSAGINTIRVTVDRSFANPIILPRSRSDDGAITYTVRITDGKGDPVPLSEIGLVLDPVTGRITGTPLLPEGEYASAYLVEYLGSDPVGNETEARIFFLIVTHDDTPPIPPFGVVAAGPADNELRSLKVSEDVTPKDFEWVTMPGGGLFRGSSGGPYAITVNGQEEVTVEAIPANDEATVTMRSQGAPDQVFARGNDNMLATDVFGQRLVITVRFPGLPDKMYYLTITNSERPGYTFEVDVGDKVYPGGVRIETLTLPEAKGGTPNYTYSLVDHDGRVRNPATLQFDSDSRELSGAPEFIDDARWTQYRLTYSVTDAAGAEYDYDFRITVCDPNDLRSVALVGGKCEPSDSVAGVELELNGGEVELTPAGGGNMYTASVDRGTEYVTVSAMDVDVDEVEIELSPDDAMPDMEGHQVTLGAGTTRITVTGTVEYGSYFDTVYTIDVTRAAGPPPTETLTESRESGSSMATLTWTPKTMNGQAAAYQYLFSVAKKAGAPVSGVAGLDLATFRYEDRLAGDVRMHEITGLMSDREYVYGVVALFGGPGNWSWGEFEIINYTR